MAASDGRKSRRSPGSDPNRRVFGGHPDLLRRQQKLSGGRDGADGFPVEQSEERQPQDHHPSPVDGPDPQPRRTTIGCCLSFRGRDGYDGGGGTWHSVHRRRGREWHHRRDGNRGTGRGDGSGNHGRGSGRARDQSAARAAACHRTSPPQCSRTDRRYSGPLHIDTKRESCPHQHFAASQSEQDTTIIPADRCARIPRSHHDTAPTHSYAHTAVR